MIDTFTLYNPVVRGNIPVKVFSESFPPLPTDVAFDSDDEVPFVTFSFTASAEDADK